MSEQPAAPQTTEPQPPAEEPKGGEERFTQADIDRIVSDRLKRERSKLGDLDELRQKAARFDELEAANKSELEKANERIAAAEKKATEAEARAKRAAVESAVSAAAAKAGFIDPDDARRFIEADSIEFDGDEPRNLDKLLGALAKSKPHLVKAGGGTGSGDGGPRGKSDPSDPGQMFGDLVAEKLGR